MIPMSLEDRIRRLARAGQISHISLASVSGGKWQANFRDSTSPGYAVAIERDPVDALMGALDAKAKHEPRPVMSTGSKKERPVLI